MTAEELIEELKKQKPDVIDTVAHTTAKTGTAKYTGNITLRLPGADITLRVNSKGGIRRAENDD